MLCLLDLSVTSFSFRFNLTLKRPLPIKTLSNHDSSTQNYLFINFSRDRPTTALDNCSTILVTLSPRLFTSRIAESCKLVLMTSRSCRSANQILRLLAALISCTGAIVMFATDYVCLSAALKLIK